MADDRRAAELGHRLFFDAGLSRDGSVSCATCHVPDLLFTDGRATSRGLADTSRNAPTLVGAAHSPWMFWDGRRDSLWAQALGPLEAPAEMGSTRTAVVRRVTTDPTLATLYRRVFGNPPSFAEDDPRSAGPFGTPDERSAWLALSERERRGVDEAFSNIGKALGAYERLLVPGPSRFDRYVDGDTPRAEKHTAESGGPRTPGTANLPIGEPDCNNNGIDDVVDIDGCPPDDPACSDCNSNDVPDACDVASELVGAGNSVYAELSMATGADVPVSSLVVGAGTGDVLGLAFDPNTNTLFGSDIITFTWPSLSSTRRLITIDPETGIVTHVGPMWFFDVQGLAFDPNTNTLFGTDAASDQLIISRGIRADPPSRWLRRSRPTRRRRATRSGGCILLS